MVQSSQMTRLFVLLAIFSLFSLADTKIIKYVKRCPTRIERHFINQYSDCKQPDMFHCTYDDHFELVETCNTYIQLPPGNYPRYNSFSDRITYEECPKNRYQPWPVKSYEIAECEVAKSSCTGAGQIPCDSGTSTTDATCRCDFTQGFVPMGQLRCCSPSETQNCFCQYRPCEDEMQELNSDYVCVPKCQTGYIRLPGQTDCILVPTTDATIINTTITTSPSTIQTDAAMVIAKLDKIDKTAILVAVGFFFCFFILLAICYYGKIWRPFRMQLFPFLIFLGILTICYVIAVVTISQNYYDVHAKYLVTVLMIFIILGTLYCAYLIYTYDLKKDRITYNEDYEFKIYTLLKAAAKGDLTTIKSLYGEGYIDLFDTDYDKRSALHLAACEGQIEVIEYLMKHKAAYPEAKDRCMEFTALEDARWHKEKNKNHVDYDSVINILSNTNKNKSAFRKVNFREDVAQRLITAGEKGDLDELKRLKELGTDMNLSNSTGRTALHAASEHGQLSAVKYLLENCNVCPFVRWSDKRPIDLLNITKYYDVKKEIEKSMKSYLDSKTPIVKMQIEKNSDISVVRLLNYASRGDLKHLRCLHASNCETMKQADYDQRTALHIAVCDNQEYVVEFLLKDCGLTNEAETAVDRWNNTPVMLAKERGNKEIFEIFLKYCPNLINTESDEYKTFSLISAGSKGDIETLKKLYESGFDINKQDYDGRTALHLSAAEWKLDALNYLIEKCGCNTHIIDRNGRSPVDEIKEEANQANFKTFVFKPSLSPTEDRDLLEITQSFESETKFTKTNMRLNIKRFRRQKSKEQQLDESAAYRKPLQIADRSIIGVLFEAAAKGDIDTIKSYGFKYFDVEDYNKNTPLHLAAANGHLEVVKYLIEEQHVSPFARDNSMKTALDLVNDKIKLLVNREATYSNINQRKRFTELRNYLDKVTEQQLSEQNVEEDPVFKRYNKDVQIFMLLQKSYKGDIISVRRYIKSDESNTLINKTDYDQRTALHIAVAEQHDHIVRYFLEDKNLKTIIRTDLKDRWGNTPQMEAENNNFQDLVDIFKLNC